MSRKPLIAGNWKMNLNHFEAIALVQKIAFSLPDKYYDRVDVAVIPPFTDLRSVQTLVDGDKLRLTYGAQDLSQHDLGAYTGEISGAFLAKLGCSYVIVGHSERRTYHDEADALVAAKAAAALKHELSPIVCIGEHLEVREAGEHVGHCQDQLSGSLAGLSSPMSRCGRSAPGGWPVRPMPRRCARRSARSWARWRRRTSPRPSGCSTAGR
jgi:triosephosphate isomerase (TIM)